MNSKILKLAKLSALLAVIFLAASCSHVLIPVDGPVYRGERMKVSDLRVEVIPGQYYVKFHRDDRYLPVHVIIRNHTKRPIKISSKNFLMLDDQGNKFRPAKLRDVIEYYRIMSMYVFPYYNSYDWYYRYYRPVSWHHPHSREYSFRLIEDTFLQNQRLAPGDSTAGFVYFTGAAHFADDTVTLVARFPANRKPVEYIFEID